MASTWVLVCKLPTIASADTWNAFGVWLGVTVWAMEKGNSSLLSPWGISRSIGIPMSRISPRLGIRKGFDNVKPR